MIQTDKLFIFYRYVAFDNHTGPRQDILIVREKEFLHRDEKWKVVMGIR